MTRKKLTLALLISLFFSQAHALGLGDLDLRSALTEPLDARIKLNYSSPDEVREARVGLASSVEFEKAGISRPFILSQLRFSIKQDQSGRYYVQIESRKSLHEPYLEFVLRLDSSYGSLLKSYALLLDPPTYQPPSSSRSETQAPSIEAPTASTTYGPVQRSETLWVIADRLRPNRSITVEQMMLALQRANPAAFIDNNINRLKQNSVLQVPGLEQIQQITPRQARREFLVQVDEWKSGKKRNQTSSPKPTTATSPQTTPSPQPVEPAPPAPSVPEPTGAQPAESETTAQPAEAMLRVAETDLSQIPPNLDTSDPDYPADPKARLQSQIADSEQELQAVNEINRDLDELKATLEGRLDALQALLKERDELIESLRQQVEAKEARLTEQSAVSSKPEPAAPVKVSSELASVESDVQGPFIRWLGDPANIPTILALFALGVLFLVMLFRPLFQRTTVAVDGPDQPRSKTQTNRVLPERDTRSFMPQDEFALNDTGDENATQLIRQAIESNPNDPALKVILLEMYAIAGDTANFSACLEQYHEEIASKEPAYWSRVVEIGSTMNPVHPIIARALS